MSRIDSIGDVQMSITIRRALAEDAHVFTDCFISCLQTAYRGIMPDEYLNNLLADREQRTEKFHKNLANTDLETYCILVGAKMIGFLVTHISKSRI